jgi:hypothetical protein
MAETPDFLSINWYACRGQVKPAFRLVNEPEANDDFGNGSGLADRALSPMVSSPAVCGLWCRELQVDAEQQHAAI